MIKLGDKFLDNNNHVFVVRQVKNGRVLLNQENSSLFINMLSEHLVHVRYRRFVDYEEYEQQKQRADEAEKRADAAEDRLNKVKDILMKSRASLSVDIFRNNRSEDKQYFQFCSDVIALIENLERGEE